MSLITPSGAAAGSRRFWRVVLCFALANLLLWVGFYTGFGRHRLKLLHVESFDPAGLVISERPTFNWRFNLDVARHSGAADNVGSIKPAIAGKWEFTDARTLRFTPNDALPKATRFEVTLAADRVRSTDGFWLDKPFTATVETAPLQFMQARQSAFDSAHRLTLELEFNDRVIPADVANHLTLYAADGRHIDCRLLGDAVSKVVRVVTDPVQLVDDPQQNTTVYVKISPGLAGVSGPLALDRPVEQSVTIAAQLAVMQVTGETNARRQPAMFVQFNNSVKADDVDGLISVDPKVPFRLASADSQSVRLIGDFKPGTRYTVRIAGGLPQTRPSDGVVRQIPRPGTFSVIFPDLAPSGWFDHASGYLGANGNRTVLAHACNVFDLQVTVTRVYDSNLVVWRNQCQRWSSDVTAYAHPIASKHLQLPREKNKVQDLPISLDDLLPSDAPRDGVYRIAISDLTYKTGLNGTTAQAEDESSDDDDRDTYDGGNGIVTTVTLSDIGLSAKQSHDQLLVWAISLSSGKPLTNVRVRVFSSKNQPVAEARTSSAGLAQFDNLRTVPGEITSVILADSEAAAPAKTEHANLTWLDITNSQLDLGAFDVGGRTFLRKGYEAFVYADRGVYRPGEVVHLRAIVRGRDNSVPAVFPVQWQLRKPDLRDWKTEMATLDADGSTGLDLQLPTDLPTGRWSAEIGFPAEAAKPRQVFGEVSFQVEEFMPNRMKVAVFLPAQGDAKRVAALPGHPLLAEVQADYLFGKPVSDRPATMSVRATPGTFYSPQWQGWTFGDSAGAMPILLGRQAMGARIDLSAATLDAKGHARFEIACEDIFVCDKSRHKRPSSTIRHGAGVIPVVSTNATTQDDDEDEDDLEPFHGPWRVSLSASVMETGGRAVTAVQTADVDCVPVYTGIQFDSDQIKPKVPATCKISMVLPDGKPSDQDCTVQATLYRQTWNNSLVDDGHGHSHFQSTCKLTEQKNVGGDIAITKGKGQLRFIAPSAGNYVLCVRDEDTGFVSTRAFIATIDSWDDNISRADPEKIDVLIRPAPALPPGAIVLPAHLNARGLLTAAKATAWNMVPGQHAANLSRPSRMAVGDDAEIIVSSPFAGQLLLTVETDRIVRSLVMDMPASQMSLRLPITADCRPNAYITATVIRKVDPAAKWVAHRAYGVARLAVDNTDRQLQVQFAAPVETRPAQVLAVNLRITDQAGNPVPQAAVTVAAVDEGICQLTAFTTPNPFRFFTAHRALGVKWFDFYADLMPEVDKPKSQSAIGGDGGDDSNADEDMSHQSPVTARRVKSLALFSGVLHTDSNGVAHADLEIPEFFGQVRLMAVAYGGAKFGSGDKDVYVRSPLLVQSSWPRFAAPGDKWRVPLTIFNNSKTADDVKISLELPPDDGGNPLAFAGTTAKVLDLPAMRVATQATVWVEVSAGPAAGIGHAVIHAAMGNETSTEHIELPIRPASPAVTLGGFVDAKPTTPALLKLPTGMMPGASELQIRCQASDSLDIPRGLEYLDHYPYGCLEQTVSTLFPLVYLDQIGKRIAPGVFDRASVNDKVQAGVLRMLSMQTTDGGLAMWPGENRDWEWGSIYAAHFVVTAEKAGYAIPDDFRDNLLHYVRTRLNRGGDDTQILEQDAYACYVLALAGKSDQASMNRLQELIKASEGNWEGRPAITGQTRFQLAAAWLASGRGDLAQALVPPTLPQPRKERQLGGNLGSGIRDRAILIETLIAVRPDHPQLPALVGQLAESLRQNRYVSTQETAFAVMALGHWIKIAAPEKPYESARLLLADTIAAQTAAEPLLWTASSRPGQEHLRPSTMPAESDSVKVAVTGPAQAVGHVSWLFTGVPLQPPANADNGMKVRRQYLDAHGKPLDGKAVHSGDLVQVMLTVESLTPLENVVIDDLLPAGLEIENPNLATTADPDLVVDQGHAAKPQFYTQRRQVRDDRMVLMGNLSMTGSAQISYLARAVTPGTFVAPPVRAECMYDGGINSLYRDNATLVVLPVVRDALAGK